MRPGSARPSLTLSRWSHNVFNLFREPAETDALIPRISLSLLTSPTTSFKKARLLISRNIKIISDVDEMFHNS